MITIYGLDGCAACQEAVDLCKSNGLKFQYFLATPRKVAEFTGDNVAPFILVDNQYLGTLDHFKIWIGDVTERTENIRKLLATSDIHIEFKKVDGNMRTMHCSTSPQWIPTEHLPTQKEDNKIVDRLLIKAYDIESKGWRSIRGERVLRYT